MASKSVVLVTAPGGHVGSKLVPELLQDNVKLVLPTSNATRLRSGLPPTATQDNVAVEEGSIADPNWVQAIVEKHGVNAVFLNLTGTNELLVTANFLDAIERAKTVKQLVYVSACGDYSSPEGYRQSIAQYGAAHVLVKPTIETKLLHCGYAWTTTVLGPTLFFDNDLRIKDAILSRGIFDEPLSRKGVSRVSTADIATVARNAFRDPKKWAGKKIMIGSKHQYTGVETEKLWTQAVGKDVKIFADDEAGFAAFEEAFSAKVKDPAFAREIRLMYETFAAYGFGMTDEEYQLQIDCLGREPASYEEFVAQTGKAWRS